MKGLIISLLCIMGYAWGLAEAALAASEGSWIPLIIYVLAFIVAITLGGSLPVSDAACNLGGFGFFVLCVGYGALRGVGSIVDGAILLGAAKMIFAALGVLAVYALSANDGKEEAHGGAH
jgi:hypothetical protein